MKENYLTNKKFGDFELDESLKSGLNDAGFEFCTPIQAATLPIALEGKDVAGQAQTGTGKTIAFLLACSDYLLRQQVDPDRRTRDVLALILAPTRELAIQIHQDAEILLKHTGLRIGLIYGGTKYDSQKAQLESGVELLIGTPGRLIDLFNQKLFSLMRAQVLVIDEADRMFDMGFIQDIRFLIRRMPPAANRLNLLYSATLSYRVMELAYEHMNDPCEIKMDDQVQVASGIREQCYCPATEEKPLLLMNMLKRFAPARALVFANTRVTVDKISRLFKKHRIPHGILAGHVSQMSREKELERFKQGKTLSII
ncbi:MAG: DEAD/DEAH box helicase, partial [Gammaproteobacteria bacterium]|nr:DEAD/DEAH box helicase [Gammaproteobacteria bacterium]